jgi:hypothetical protein
MDHVEQALAEFNARRNSSASSKIDALLDIEQLSDARVMPFLLQVAINSPELTEVRAHVIKGLCNRHPAIDERASVARAIGSILDDGWSADLRAQSVTTLAEFTDIEGVTRMLGTVAHDGSNPLDLRYSACMSLERAGPRPECVDIVHQLAVDETFGRSVRRLLSTTWNRP